MVSDYQALDVTSRGQRTRSMPRTFSRFSRHSLRRLKIARAMRTSATPGHTFALLVIPSTLVFAGFHRMSALLVIPASLGSIELPENLSRHCPEDRNGSHTRHADLLDPCGLVRCVAPSLMEGIAARHGRLAVQVYSIGHAVNATRSRHLEHGFPASWVLQNIAIEVSDTQLDFLDFDRWA